MDKLPRELQLDATAPFKELLRFAVSHGLELLQRQGDLMPMVITLINGNHGITVLSAPSKTPDQMAKDYIAKLPEAIDAYAVLLRGKVPLAEKYSDAIIIMGGERTRSYGHRLAQPYRRNLLRKVIAVGDPVYGGRTEQFVRLG